MHLTSTPGVGYETIRCLQPCIVRGARVSEITQTKIMDLSLGTPSIRIHGKGRKDRVMPLWQNTAKLLKSWLTHLRNDPENPLFPSARGQNMTRHGVEYRLAMAKKTAEAQCPSLNKMSHPTW